jgi:hypothetical protein
MQFTCICQYLNSYLYLFFLSYLAAKVSKGKEKFMSNYNNGQIPSVSTINPKPDEDEILAQVDPQYADEEGELGSMPATGADIAEEDTDELAHQVGMHTEKDHKKGIKPLSDPNI